ncbi:MAG TPA: ATP-binding protein [Lacipirellulaceae bacterium]|jgi:two-component system phosphate regulon sensor histidine kinase PhoR|nr:ATP-binding protein [Lacipirellulaceae bacterium]
MHTSRFFWKLVVLCSGLNFVAAVTVGFVLSIALQQQILDAVTARRWIWALVSIESLVVLAVTYWLVGILVRPVTALNEAANAIAAGNYEHRVYVPNRDEFGVLAGTLNRMSAALEFRMTQLSQTAARQSTALGGMIEGVIAVDARQRIVLANTAAGRQYNFRPAEVEGRALLEVIRNHALHAAVTTALATGESQRFETQRIGTPKVHVEIHVQPLPGESCPGVVLVIHDTTELRRLESIRRDFVANVSHELKTPLSSIKAYTETLQIGADPETTQRFLGRIEEQANRLHHLILDMLMLARIESDHQPFEIVSVDVADMARACIESQRPAAEAKWIMLTAAPDGDARSDTCRARVDREGLREILDNLVDNAIKYTPESGTVTIAWRIAEPAATHRVAGEEEKNGDGSSSGSSQSAVCILTVTDSGIGIKPADQERVFERFYRVDKARSRELGGTGLGLSIVKHLAQSFGGRVAVESTPGQGSTFTVELPVG